jgi:AraC family transcriptional regulator
MDELYTNRINQVVDYIQDHLEEELSLKQLAGVACFSEFHFCRVFKAVMGEPAYQFIRRLRLEKSADLLLTSSTESITEIALRCGFATSSSFAKSFKKHFGMSASQWRNKSSSFFNRESTPVQIERGHISVNKGSPVWTFPKEDSIRQVVIENIASLKVAYVRNIGPYQGDEILFANLYDQLYQWALPRGHITETTFTLNIYHDNPEITEHQKLRVMTAIPVTETAHAFGSVGVTKLSGGKYGVCRFLLKEDEFREAWDWMFSVWLLNSGYERDNREALERCYGEKTIQGVRYFKVDICIPVKAT